MHVRLAELKICWTMRGVPAEWVWQQERLKFVRPGWSVGGVQCNNIMVPVRKVQCVVGFQNRIMSSSKQCRAVTGVYFQTQAVYAVDWSEQTVCSVVGMSRCFACAPLLKLWRAVCISKAGKTGRDKTRCPGTVACRPWYVIANLSCSSAIGKH